MYAGKMQGSELITCLQRVEIILLCLFLLWSGASRGAVLLLYTVNR
jgi:hypothetical protein